LNIGFYKAASEEFEKAVEYFEEQRSGLGEEFCEEVAATIDRIQFDPTSFERAGENIYRCRTKRFQYEVVYRVEHDQILIVAVAHLHRRPGYWKRRIT
jgi:hypothetical protein